MANMGAGLTIHTAPLEKEEELTKILRLQGKDCMTVFVPLSNPEEQIIEIDTDLETKSQSARIRNVLYVLWEQGGKQGNFPDFYKNKTEMIIEWIKKKLD
jgi:hypothetical protein